MPYTNTNIHKEVSVTQYFQDAEDHKLSPEQRILANYCQLN